MQKNGEIRAKIGVDTAAVARGAEPELRQRPHAAAGAGALGGAGDEPRNHPIQKVDGIMICFYEYTHCFTQDSNLDSESSP